MTRVQRGLAYIAACTEVRRDFFLRSYPADLLDALVSKGFAEVKDACYRVTESGHRAINDRGQS